MANDPYQITNAQVGSHTETCFINHHQGNDCIGVRNNLFGLETIYFNQQPVSKKWSLLGGKHRFQQNGEDYSIELSKGRALGGNHFCNIYKADDLLGQYQVQLALKLWMLAFLVIGAHLFASWFFSWLSLRSFTSFLVVLTAILPVAFVANMASLKARRVR